MVNSIGSWKMSKHHEHSAMKGRDGRVPNLWSLSAPIDTSLIASAKV